MNTYWNGKGKYQRLADKLQKLVPAQGAVTTGAALERFRVASNCYYDLYNNHLGNRAGEFRKVFGFSAAAKIREAGSVTPEIETATEAKMDEIILTAATEQRLVVGGREIVEYGEYEFKPRNEQGWPDEDTYGYWVVKDHVNIMPGGCWFHTIAEARHGVKMLELAKGNANLFWLLMGNAGLTTTTDVGGVHDSITCDVIRGTEVVRDDSTIDVRGPALIGIRPKEALALSIMLRKAAERALGNKV